MFGFFSNPSKQQFASHVLQSIKAAGGPDFEYDAGAFEIRHGTNRGFLGNTYVAYCQASGAHRKAILQNFVSAFVQQQNATEISFAEAEPRLVTVVRERALFSLSSLYWQLDGATETPKELVEPLSSWFVKTAVIDSPSSMMLVNQEQVSRWGQTSDEIFATGLHKLQESTMPQFKPERGYFRGTWNDDYDSSRILVPGVFDDLPLEGDPVVTLPNRLTLLVAGSGDADGVRAMLRTAEEIVQSGARPQNPAPLVVRDGTIADFHVEPTSSVFNEVERAHRMAALFYYEEQQQALEKLYAQKGKDLFVAKYTLIEQDTKCFCSYAAWTKGVPTLLPQVDEVLFMDMDRSEAEQCVVRAPWSSVVAVLPDLLLDTTMFPARFFVSQFPTAAQLARLQ